MIYANVVFPVSRPLVLTYRVPDDLAPKIRIGHKVTAPVGKASRLGVVVGISSQASVPDAKLKPLTAISGPLTFLPAELLKMCEWAASYYCCTLGQVLNVFGSALSHVSKRPRKQFEAMENRNVISLPTLSPDQETVFRQCKMHATQKRPAPVLLHGVTGSGKTHVYFALARHTLERGGSVLFLLPEIGLAQSMARKMEAFFGDPIALLHSKLSKGERTANWERIRSGICRIVIGARSGVWAPLENIGLIIVDEEHDGSYKQNEGVPRYNARDVAVYRGFVNRALVVLGSATPSAESYANAGSGKYHMERLPRRFGRGRLPHVKVVDMRREHQAGNWNPLSGELEQAVGDRLSKRQQVILLLNRRGFAPLFLCRHCGHVEHCSLCDVGMTYHAAEGKLRCHYCGLQNTAPSQCPVCGGLDLHFKGTGVQKVEAELRRLFPDATIRRMDTDSTRRKHARSEILEQFEKGDADILVGTQMVAKGLDFPNVSLVGIVSADTGLNMPDFRASENTFQLVSQVAGRCGRGEIPGEVILQTYSPENPALRAATIHDVEGFLREEEKSRRALSYPPFARLIQLQISHPSQTILLKSARKLVTLLRKNSEGKTIILGPAPPPVGRHKGRYRMLILLKDTSARRLHRIVTQTLAAYDGRPARTIVDVDPVSML